MDIGHELVAQGELWGTMHNKALLLYANTRAATMLGGSAASPPIGETGGGCEAASRNTSDPCGTGEETPCHQAMPDDDPSWTADVKTRVVTALHCRSYRRLQRRGPGLCVGSAT